jgi:hypothetical protein
MGSENGHCKEPLFLCKCSPLYQIQYAQAPQINTTGKPPCATWAHPYENEKYFSMHDKPQKNIRKCQHANGGDLKPCTGGKRRQRHNNRDGQQAGGSVLQPLSFLEPVCYTVEELTADRSLLVRDALNFFIPSVIEEDTFVGYYKEYIQRSGTQIFDRRWCGWKRLQRHLPVDRSLYKAKTKPKCQCPYSQPALSLRKITDWSSAGCHKVSDRNGYSKA